MPSPIDTQLQILPDRSSARSIGVMGAVILVGICALVLLRLNPSWWPVFGDGEPRTGFYLGTLIGLSVGAFFAAYARVSLRPRDPVPRIEISRAGLTDVTLFHRRFIAWSEMERLDPRVVEGESTDYIIDFYLKSGMQAEAAKRRPYSLNLNVFLLRDRKSFQSTSEIADWLGILRNGAPLTDRGGLFVRLRVREPSPVKP